MEVIRVSIDGNFITKNRIAIFVLLKLIVRKISQISLRTSSEKKFGKLTKENRV